MKSLTKLYESKLNESEEIDKVKMKQALVTFQKSNDLIKLEKDLLALNPYKNGIQYNAYIDWINDNIKWYKNGDTYVFSLTSSGSVLNSLDD
ncbi:gp143 [Sphingomonas phage PAU]|uniref:gp143 n=1 Tax=Sphingomonas phage PAU TaxID=1150991 RepID=UPI00025732DB|nr:gp143 [Sphingomonas phage PAU]AFF28141.1 gp143 [Sphingomonas phage PAU]